MVNELEKEVARAALDTRLKVQRGGPKRLTATDKAIAQAAIAIVVERCAEVADGITVWDSTMRRDNKQIAAAIRSLSKEPTQ